MITPSGKVLQIHGKRHCKQCKEITDQACFFCERCETNTVVTKEIPIPTEKAMLVKLLMSLSERYELKGTRISVDYREVRATFTFPEYDLPKLREIANNWAERGYINTKHLLMLKKAGMRDVTRIPPRLAPLKGEARRETMRRVFDE
jgi:hypothetical protein